MKILVVAGVFAGVFMGAAQGATLAGDANRFAICSGLAQSDPARAIAVAQAWRIEGGGIDARHCLALAQFGARDYAAALNSFTAAARDAERAPETREKAIMLWQAGANAALISDRGAAAATMVDAALALSPPAAEAAAMMLLKAEALVDLKQDGAAMAAIDAALALDADVPDGWLLKATLARRMGNAAMAQAAILQAAKRAPQSASVSYEAGNISVLAGKGDLARQAWTAAAASEPDSFAGKAAAEALAVDAKAPALTRAPDAIGPAR